MQGENQTTEEVPQEVENEQDLSQEHEGQTEDELASSETEDSQDEGNNDNTSEDESQDSEEPAPSKGLDKRLSKVLERNEELQARIWQIERELMSKQAPQQSYQQQVQQQPQIDPRVDPNSGQFDLVYAMGEIAKQQLQAERQQVKMQEVTKTVISDYQTVEEKLARARAIDPNFDKAMGRYEGMITPDMKYGLSALDNPVAYLKHVFKNEKDVRAFQQISYRHASEQVKLVTKLGLQFELKNPGKSNTASTPKPKPIPNLGKGGAAQTKNFNAQTGQFDPNWINERFAY